jgi:hypothetical protein
LARRVSAPARFFRGKWLILWLKIKCVEFPARSRLRLMACPTPPIRDLAEFSRLGFAAVLTPRGTPCGSKTSTVVTVFAARFQGQAGNHFQAAPGPRNPP